jgi:hypothetical protein
LGRRDDAGSPAAIVSKLGFDLFITKGLSATTWERVTARLQEEGIKQLMTVLGVVLGAGLLFWLGWRVR